MEGSYLKVIDEMPVATEERVGWQLVREISAKGAGLLEPVFRAHRGRNGRLSVQTDPRLYRDTQAILGQAKNFLGSRPISS